jgi:hypothetical protein
MSDYWIGVLTLPVGAAGLALVVGVLWGVGALLGKFFGAMRVHGTTSEPVERARKAALFMLSPRYLYFFLGRSLRIVVLYGQLDGRRLDLWELGYKIQEAADPTTIPPRSRVSPR